MKSLLFLIGAALVLGTRRDKRGLIEYGDSGGGNDIQGKKQSLNLKAIHGLS
jgi:hypothetical protein